MKISIYKSFVAVVLIAFSFSFVAPLAQAQVESSEQQTMLSSDDVKLHLIQLLLQLLEQYKAQLAEMQQNQDREEKEEKKANKKKEAAEKAEKEEQEDEEKAEPEEREVITLTSQGVGEWVERSEDLDATVTLAVFDIYAKREDLNGTTFRALVQNVPRYTKITYTCPEIIQKGDTKNCRVKITGAGGYNGIKYSIQNIMIEAVDGTVYKNKFPAVEGYIANQ